MHNEETLDNLHRWAEEAEEEDRDAAVVEYLAPYLRRRTDDADAWFLFGKALRRLGLYAEAESALLEALHLRDEGSRWSVQVQLALLNRASGHLTTSEDWFVEALKDPDAAAAGWVWNLRGGVLARQGQLAAAESCHRKATELGEEDRAEAYLNLGLVLRARGKYEEAIEALDIALELNPDESAAIDARRSIDGVFEAIETARTLTGQR